MIAPLISISNPPFSDDIIKARPKSAGAGGNKKANGKGRRPASATGARMAAVPRPSSAKGVRYLHFIPIF